MIQSQHINNKELKWSMILSQHINNKELKWIMILSQHTHTSPFFFFSVVCHIIFLFV